MKTNLILTFILFLIMIFFPFITLLNGEKGSSTETTQAETVSTSAEKEASAAETVSVMSSATGEVTEMSIQDYVYGALCAEMPASFHEEALKAQAVACYTYMKWLKENADNTSELKADITDSAETHQAYLTDDELKEKWGTSYDIYSQKVKKAVESVLYEYLEYENETAMTVFHALSPGMTRSAEEVWNSPLPYLQNATAPGDKLSPDFSSEVVLTREEFLSAFEGAEEKDIKGIFESIKEDSEGLVTEITFGKKAFSKTDLRSAFSLASPYFKLQQENETVIVTVYGKGHGIGMSQYSADYMARQGSTYEEILAHFYLNTVLVKPQQ